MRTTLRHHDCWGVGPRQDWLMFYNIIRWFMTVNIRTLHITSGTWYTCNEKSRFRKCMFRIIVPCFTPIRACTEPNFVIWRHIVSTRTVIIIYTLCSNYIHILQHCRAQKVHEGLYSPVVYCTMTLTTLLNGWKNRSFLFGWNHNFY